MFNCAAPFPRDIAVALLAGLALGACGGGQDRWLSYDVPAPAQLVGAPAFARIGMGSGHACMLTAAGRAWCWGLNDAGQLGSASRATCGDDDAFACSSVPLAVNGTPALSAVDAGRFTTCALAAGGRAWCWGGANDLGPRPVPRPVGAPGDLFVQIDVGTFGGDACGLKSDGSAWCWGATSPGTLRRVAPGLSLSRIALGDLHACALDTAGHAWCWLTVDYPVPGSAFSGSAGQPVAVGGGRRFQSIGVGSMHACALALDGAAWCWGAGPALGVGDPAAFSSEPRAVSGPRFARLSAGDAHSCALTADGVAWCWGDNLSGQIGDGTFRNVRPAPVRVGGGIAWRELAAGGASSCGIANDGTAWCWGWNAFGAVGQPVVGHWVPF